MAVDGETFGDRDFSLYYDRGVLMRRDGFAGLIYYREIE